MDLKLLPLLLCSKKEYYFLTITLTKAVWFIYALCWSHWQVRCAAVFALGTFVGNSAERTDHSTTIDHNVAMMLAQLINDGSPIVRKASLLEFNQLHYHSLKSVLMLGTVPLGTGDCL